MIRRVIVFVDWDTARRVVPGPRVPITDVKRAARQIEQVFVALQGIIAAHLQQLDNRSVFRVRWRLYHGWYSGKTKTPDYRAVERYLSEASSKVIGQISFGVDVVVAVNLISGGKRMPLYDSLRQLTEPDGSIVVRQKMVDTALTCDLLQSTRSARDDVHLLIGGDDDLLPGMYMAESWGAIVHMCRLGEPSHHLNTRGLVTVIARQGA